MMGSWDKVLVAAPCSNHAAEFGAAFLFSRDLKMLKRRLVPSVRAGFAIGAQAAPEPVQRDRPLRVTAKVRASASGPSALSSRA
jgi:hypothetical protein